MENFNTLNINHLLLVFMETTPPNPNDRKKERVQQPDKNLFLKCNPEHRKRRISKMFQGHGSLHSKKREAVNST